MRGTHGRGGESSFCGCVLSSPQPSLWLVSTANKGWGLSHGLHRDPLMDIRAYPDDISDVGDIPLQSVYYFEVKVVEGADNAAVSLGLASRSTPLHRQPGTTPGTYGYRGIDGRVFGDGMNLPRGKDYGPSFGAGDIVGCGVVFAR